MMDDKIKILLAFVLLALAASIAVFYFWFNSQINLIPEDPKVYVKNMTAEDKINYLYKERIVKYPVKAGVMPFMLNESLKIGISVDKTQLDFGLVTKGLSVNKVLDFKNNDNLPAKVNVVAYGRVKPLVSTPESSFILKNGDKRSITITMNATDVGKYEGEVDIIMRVPTFSPLVYIMK